MKLRVGPQQVGGARVLQRRPLADAYEHVGEQRVVLAGIDDRVGRNVRHAALARELHELHVAPGLFGGEVLQEFEVETVPEERDEPPHFSSRLVEPIARERALDAAEWTARERD